MFETVLSQVRQKKPLVHAITNHVTIHDCANIMLACGGSPIMADAVQEVKDITASCDGLVLNLGMLNESKIQSMRISASVAAEQGKPVVLDPVGVAASAYRLDIALELLQSKAVSVICGNASEIRTLFSGKALSKGVDAVICKDWKNQVAMAKELSRIYKTIVVQTGETDIVTDGTQVYSIYNGHAMMRNITGSGCMLSCVIGVLCAANPNQLLRATGCAVCMMGLAGELAFEKTQENNEGTASFAIRLIDEISKMNEVTLQGGMKLEFQSE